MQDLHQGTGETTIQKVRNSEPKVIGYANGLPIYDQNPGVSDPEPIKGTLNEGEALLADLEAEDED